MVERVGLEADFIVTGGIAKNVGVLKKIQEKTGTLKIIRAQDPQIIGALGAALFARKRMEETN
jgi:activator of 2-hydroxyglutaryl-CoA dehydratase